MGSNVSDGQKENTCLKSKFEKIIRQLWNACTRFCSVVMHRLWENEIKEQMTGSAANTNQYGNSKVHWNMFLSLKYLTTN